MYIGVVYEYEHTVPRRQYRNEQHIDRPYTSTPTSAEAYLLLNVKEHDACRLFTTMNLLPVAFRENAYTSTNNYSTYLSNPSQFLAFTNFLVV